MVCSLIAIAAAPASAVAAAIVLNPNNGHAGTGYAVICNFQGNYGLIPNAPTMQYALACINRWLYPLNPDTGLTMMTALAVINAWLYPVQ